MRVRSFFHYSVFTVCIAAVLVLVLWFLVANRGREESQGEQVLVPAEEGHHVAEPASTSTIAKGVEVQVKVAGTQEETSTTNDQQSRNAQLKQERLAEAQQAIDHLQKLMDDDSKQAEAFAYAKKLIKHGITAERLAGVKAMEWYGGREAVETILPMLAEEDPEIADNVDETLRHLIEESLYTDVRVMDKESWLEALKAAGNEDSMYGYLTLLSAFSEYDSVPVLLDLFNSKSDLDRKLAQEFMEFISHGEQISSSEAAQAWWKKWMADRGITEQDLKDYENAGKEENSALAGQQNEMSAPQQDSVTNKEEKSE